MSAAALKFPTYEDILALGEDVHAEILNGELFIHASPSWQHGDASGSVMMELGKPFKRGDGGPGGWWLLQETDIVLSTGDVVRPDLLGIRRDRMPTLPDDRPLAVDPEFVCEILSPSTETYDLTDKQAAYHAAGVEHLWHLSPHGRLLTVMRRAPEGYLILVRGRDGQTLRLPPFDAISIAISGLFPPLPPAPPPPAQPE